MFGDATKSCDLSWVWSKLDGAQSWQTLGPNGLRQGASKAQAKQMQSRISSSSLFRLIKDSTKLEQEGQTFR